MRPSGAGYWPLRAVEGAQALDGAAVVFSPLLHWQGWEGPPAGTTEDREAKALARPRPVVPSATYPLPEDDCVRGRPVTSRAK